MAVDFFLKVDGVSGESADANHSGWIDVVSCGWGATQNASITGGGGGSGKVSFNDLSIVADMDKATPPHCLSFVRRGSMFRKSRYRCAKLAAPKWNMQSLS